VSLLFAETSVKLANPEAIVDAFHEHFAEHIPMTREGHAIRFEADYGHGTFSAEDGHFAARVNCVSENVLMSVKAMVAEHIVEFSGDDSLDFRWLGHGADLRELPNLFTGRVARAYDITPRMRRVVIAIDRGMERLMTGGMHVRILILSKNCTQPVWPHLSKTGAIVWPEGDNELARRVYTIRSANIERGEVDIDFVLHEGDNMPGANFGATAKPGDIVGIVGPGGVRVEAENYVFAGDETALPVMLRMAEEMPADRQVTVFAEIDNEAERQEIVSKANIQWNWVYRHGKPAGTSGLLEAALGVHDFGTEHDGLHVFVGCEKTEARAIKKLLCEGTKLPKTCVHSAGYWNKGADDDGH
jgi:NADPH-dependent ferric siderophore reductase